jgi:hypothetical protein
MIMQVNRIAAGIAAGVALLSAGEVFAHAPNVTPNLEIFASGASAQDSNVESLFSELCVSGTLDVYYDNVNPAKPGANHRAYFCTLDGAKVTGLDNSNPRVLFHKRSAGGSAYGVNTLLDGAAISAMVVRAANCKLDPAETVTVNGKPIYRCSANEGTSDVVSVASDVGVSDVNPTMFRALNTPAGFKDVVIKDVNTKLVVQSGGALVFGVPVTKSLRDALQRAQIAQERLPSDCAEGDDTARCMPSLSRYQIASLFSGKVGKWSNFKVIDAQGNSLPLTSYAKGTELGTDQKVYLCRRVRGSGTQTQFNAKFLNYPCAGTAGLAPTEVNNALAGPVTILNSGSGDVDICLDDFNNGTNNGKSNAKLLKAWAIGVQSTERNNDLKYGYRFIKVDGVAPTVEEAVSGRYMDFAEVTWQWLKPAYAGPTGDKLKIIQKIAKDAGRPNILGGINAKLVHPFGHGGYAAVSSAGWTVPANGKLDINNPITPYTHAPGKTALDNCRVPSVDPGKPSAL